MPSIICISENPDKIAEYRTQFLQYGIEIETRPWHADEKALENDIQKWLKDAESRDPEKKIAAYALNEWSNIYNAETHRQSPKTEDMEPVYNKGEIITYWLDDKGDLCKAYKEHRIYGYIDLARAESGGFGWDHLFVNAITGKSYAESIPLWGKCTPRQLLISDFIQQHLFYKKRKKLNFSDSAPEETIAFVSVAAELGKNPLFLDNTHLKDKGLHHFISHAIHDGIHLRFAKNRRENNYWMPGLNGGLPAVAKPDAVHEATYRFHDLMHYGLAPFCDLIPTDDFSMEARRVYHAARMMSEAFSLVMADMLYVDSLKKSGVVYDYSQRNVYPVFERIIDPANNLKALFKASARYALLGEDRHFRSLMSADTASETALGAFKEWYSRFFTADNVWTNKNFENIAQQEKLYKDWYDMIGADLFKLARVTLLNDMTARIKAKGVDMASYSAVVDALFEEIFENHVLPRLHAAPADITVEEEISNAFRRYMLGQSLFYVRYKALPGMSARADNMIKRLKGKALFSAEDIADIRKEFEKDIMLAHGAQVITHDDRRIFTQVFPFFPPVYLESYAKQDSDIAGVVSAIFNGDMHG